MIKVLVILLTFLRFQSIVSSSNQTCLFSYSRSGGKNNGNKYKHTLHNLLTTFSSQATTTNTGFYNSTLFNRLANDNMYGLYMCRGDIDRQSCRACVNYAKHAILSKRYTTNYGHEALFWYDHCMIRYSNKPITGILNVNTSMLATWDMYNVTGNVTRFTQILRNTMNLLSVRAANCRSGKKFATSIVKLTEDESLYALAQCTPDLTVKDCRKCLVTAIETLHKMGRSKSGKILQLNCMVRFEMFPFFYSDKIKPLESSAVNLTEIRLRVRLGSYNSSVNSTSSSPSSVSATTPAITAFKGNEVGLQSE
ncbi:putative cysteine-rich receptor-like protein kinase 9 isoform X2 [Silene latifolia]|uniref:putative cysteine-rich receptor-like protein kinase 9 isoform X2 n=1 Tax=Silene latifolia TaxID=37657 RepID=UPI003D776D2F